MATPDLGRISANSSSRSASRRLLSDLPEDVLSILFSPRRYLAVSDLIALACTCKVAAAIIIPIIYTSPTVPSLHALLHLCATLGRHQPELPNSHVRRFTASQHFVLPGQFSRSPLDTGRLQQCRLTPSSPVVCMTKVREAIAEYPPTVLNHLPMPTLTRLAEICPNLCHVDLSRIPDLSFETPFLTLGILNLASILRERNGSLRTSPDACFSCVLVNDQYCIPTRPTGDNSSAPYKHKYALDIHFVNSVDWSRKHIDIHNLLSTNPRINQHTAFVPFRDLVPLDDQPTWTVRHAHLQTGIRPKPGTKGAKEVWPVSQWLGSERALWLHAGLEQGKDYVFDLSEPGAIHGAAKLCVTRMAHAAVIASSYHLDVDRQCTHMVLQDGPSVPDHVVAGLPPSMALGFVLQKSIQQLEFLNDQSFHFVTTFTVAQGEFMSHPTLSYVIPALAKGMPNLTWLDLQCTPGPLDYLCYFLDLLIRRKGTQLRHLALSHHVPAPSDQTALFSHTLVTPIKEDFKYPNLIQHRSLLDASGKSFRNPLKSLSLALVGPGLSHRTHPNNTATLVIHPGLLHGIEHLALHSVQLSVAPPKFALPSAPSLVPVAYLKLCGHAPVGCVSMSPLVTLRSMRTLDISSASMAAWCGVFADMLPHMPSLRELHVSVDAADRQRVQMDIGQVVKVLEKYPALAVASFTGVEGTADGWRGVIGERFFGPYPRELGPCPRLTCVKVNDEEPIEYFGWVREMEGRARSDEAGGKPVLLSTCVEE